MPGPGGLQEEPFTGCSDIPMTGSDSRAQDSSAPPMAPEAPKISQDDKGKVTANSDEEDEINAGSSLESDSDSDVDFILHARRPEVAEGEMEGSKSAQSTAPHERAESSSQPKKKPKKEYIMPKGMDPEYWKTYMLPGSDEEDFDEDEEELYNGLVYESENGTVPEFLEPSIIAQRTESSISGKQREHFCQFCNVAIPFQMGIQEHLRSFEHISVTRQQFGLFCGLCPQINFPHFKSLRKHIAKHHPETGGAQTGYNEFAHYAAAPGVGQHGMRMVQTPFGLMPLMPAPATPQAPYNPYIPHQFAPPQTSSTPEPTEKGHRCDPCNIVLPHGSKVRHHLKDPIHIQNVQATNCFCPLCPLVNFHSFSTLARHRLKHNGEKKVVVVDETPLVPLDSTKGHRCDACMGVIPKGAKVKNHKLSVGHQEAAARIGMVCPLCPVKAFLTWKQLETHRKEVHGEQGRDWKGEWYLRLGIDHR